MHQFDMPEPDQTLFQRRAVTTAGTSCFSGLRGQVRQGHGAAAAPGTRQRKPDSEDERQQPDHHQQPDEEDDAHRAGEELQDSCHRVSSVKVKDLARLGHLGPHASCHWKCGEGPTRGRRGTQPHGRNRSPDRKSGHATTVEPQAPAPSRSPKHASAEHHNGPGRSFGIACGRAGTPARDAPAGESEPSRPSGRRTPPGRTANNSCRASPARACGADSNARRTRGPVENSPAPC